jgi:hypothetical protein
MSPAILRPQKTMARIALGLASSHSPMLCVPAEQWVASYGAKDQHDPSLNNYQELERRNAARLAPQLSLESCHERYRRVQRAMDTIATTLQQAAPDAVIVIGDDHHEMFPEDHMPAINIYRGEKYLNLPADLEKVPPFRRAGMWAYHPDNSQWHPCHAQLARHLRFAPCKSVLTYAFHHRKRSGQ